MMYRCTYCNHPFEKGQEKTKEAERVAIKQQIQDANSGPSSREIELDRINKQLAGEQLHVKPIMSDGNCMYRYCY
jgi:hypothetical protein